MSLGLDGSLNGRLLRSEWTRGMGRQESSSGTPPLRRVDLRESGPVPVRLPGGQVRESRLAPRVAKVGQGSAPSGLLGMELDHWTSHSQTATHPPTRPRTRDTSPPKLCCAGNRTLEAYWISNFHHDAFRRLGRPRAASDRDHCICY